MRSRVSVKRHFDDLQRNDLENNPEYQHNNADDDGLIRSYSVKNGALIFEEQEDAPDGSHNGGLCHG